MKNSKMSKENLEWLLDQPAEMQYQLFQNFVDIAKIHYNQLVEEEVKSKEGEKYENCQFSTHDRSSGIWYFSFNRLVAGISP